MQSRVPVQKHLTDPSRAEALDAVNPDRPKPRDFLEIPYDQLEEMNLEAKEHRLARRPADVVRAV